MPRKAPKPKSEERQKKSLVGFRVTPEEKAEIEKAAEESGLTVGSFCRANLLKKAQTVPTKRRTADVVLLGQILGQLGKIGNNLNQIAKRLNGGKGVTVERVILALREVSISKESILKALRRNDDSEGQTVSSCGEPS